MLILEKKFRAMRDKKYNYSNSCVGRKKNSERNKINIPHQPPPPPFFKLNGRSLIYVLKIKCFIQLHSSINILFL